ncbi:hypothetical protein PAECIP111893_01147 [Paenibacillus plantiphilus]|uniref:Uncharacterized protein n=1 Tax=Paenibacillus plantiphilus TaxID=2905650 RepID=A0ABN8G994_9BACL|nr:DUF6886 family protein [Paenibacillus plantiphilus]CAH1198878.1 hypothetical protein PAECIP111893_01147 [Paenibacillus plantiphilus]
MKQLFHFSEESAIKVFVPRVKENRRDMPPVVWAIDDRHEFTFYFPRECPRIVYTRTNDMTEEDNSKFFGLTNSDIIITVETDWYERMMNTTTYRYRMPADSFQLFDRTAGYYISTQTIVPEEVEPLNNLVDRLISLNIEVRFTPNLYPLRNAILSSSITDFGIHKFANAMSET